MSRRQEIHERITAMINSSPEGMTVVACARELGISVPYAYDCYTDPTGELAAKRKRDKAAKKQGQRTRVKRTLSKTERVWRQREHNRLRYIEQCLAEGKPIPKPIGVMKEMPITLRKVWLDPKPLAQLLARQLILSDRDLVVVERRHGQQVGGSWGSIQATLLRRDTVRRFTIEQLAEKSGVDVRQIYRIRFGECQKVELGEADRLAHALGSHLTILYPPQIAA